MGLEQGLSYLLAFYFVPSLESALTYHGMIMFLLWDLYAFIRGHWDVALGIASVAEARGSNHY